MDVETGPFHGLAKKKVVIEVRDQGTEISLKDAQALEDPGGLTDIVEVDITPTDFSRDRRSIREASHSSTNLRGRT